MKFQPKTKLLLHAGAEETDKAAWLDIKKKHISGTDAGVIMGVNPYKTPYALFFEKVLPADKLVEDDVGSKESVHFGKVLEEVVASEFTRQTGLKICRKGTIADRCCDYRIANIDRKIIGENAGLECKTTSYMNREQWEDGKIPKHYYYQCIHYMLVLFCDADGKLLGKYHDACWYIACLVGGQKFVYHKIKFDQDDAYELAEKEKEFYGRIVNNLPPPITDAPSDEEFAKRTAADKDNGTLPDDFDEVAVRLRNLQEVEKETKTAIQGLKNKLIEAMREYETAESSHFSFSFKPSKPRETVQISRLKEHEEIYNLLKEKGLITVSNTVRTFRMKEK